MTHPNLPPLAPPEPERKYNLGVFIIVVIPACLLGVGIGAVVMGFIRGLY